MELEVLLQLLKKYGRPTYSDTPGMGNMRPYQFPNSSLPRSSTPRPSFESLLKPYEKTQKTYFNLRRELEQALMEERLGLGRDYLNYTNLMKSPMNIDQGLQGMWDRLEPNDFYPGWRM